MKWTKPNGTEVETGDSEEIIEYCESLGWKRKARRRPRKEPDVASTTKSAGDD